MIADPQKRARVVIIGSEPKAGEMSNRCAVVSTIAIAQQVVDSVHQDGQP
jgi:hypothetical protein